MIPYSRQSIDDADIAAVVAVLKSDFLTQGPEVPRFEAALCACTGAKFAVAVNSATSALHLACLALGIGPQDRVWTTPITFVASANAARYCGARVDFVDVELETGNLSVAALADKLVEADRLGCLPKLVIPVHFAGQPCDMAGIARLAQQYGFRVIEDASHALGASGEGDTVGGCHYADITVLSFHPVKMITTGEGGAALTNDPALAKELALLRSHGITRVATDFEHDSDGAWYYEQQQLGYNYRMTDLQAALGTSQLLKLNEFVDARRRIAARYVRELPPEAKMLVQRDGMNSSWHLNVIRVPPPCRRGLFDALRAQGIGVNVHYVPVHRQPDYQRLGFHASEFPNAEDFYARVISLPNFPSLRDSEQMTVITAVAQFFATYSR